MKSPYDLLQKDKNGSLLWIEAAPDLQTAKARLRELAAKTPGEYLVFDQNTREIIGNSGEPTPTPVDRQR